MNFGTALTVLRSGQKVRRSAWPEGRYLHLEQNSSWGCPVIVVGWMIKGAFRDFGVWCVPMSALLAEDWEAA